MPSNVILIADDDPWQRLWLTQMLHKAGFICSAVGDGADVVEQALALNPRLVILDIDMPGVDGLSAAEQLRILPNTRHIPILFVTSYANARDLLLSVSFEGADWMMKPFQPADLLYRIDRLLGGY